MTEVTIDSYAGPQPPFALASGPRNAKLAFVGEALGETEDQTGLPFMGAAGQELSRLLREVDIDRSKVFLTNVLGFRPKGNQIDPLCVTKAQAGPTYPFGPLRQGKYLHPQFAGELTRLQAELDVVRPNLVVALGNVATWALLGSGGINSLRGAIAQSVGCAHTLKVLPTYHPSAVLRQWNLRPVVLMDLIKAKREQEFPSIVRPQRQVLVNPTLAELSEWTERPALAYGVDIETVGGMIEMIGFSRSPSEAIVVPFVDRSGPFAPHYWPTQSDEERAWQLVSQLLAKPQPKIFQNGLYDLQYLARMGLRPRNCTEDTMLLHHSLYPELQKGLGFLGSIYTNEASWKLMRKRRKEDELKRDE